MSSTEVCIGCEARTAGVTHITVFWLSHLVDMEVNSDCAHTFGGIVNNQACGKAGMYTSIQSLGLIFTPFFLAFKYGT